MQTNLLASIPVSPNNDPNWLLRTLYFLFIGWWFSLIWTTVAWAFCLSLIGIPTGLWMIDRLAQVTTLGHHSKDFLVNSSSEVTSVEMKKKTFLVRAIYFVLIGWWLSAFWFALAWVLCVSVLGLPLGGWMIERAPAITILSISEGLSNDESILSFDQ
jgi:uncharacterized membrane protein YccF (DUF307 family)